MAIHLLRRQAQKSLVRNAKVRGCNDTATPVDTILRLAPGWSWRLLDRSTDSEQGQEPVREEAIPRPSTFAREVEYNLRFQIEALCGRGHLGAGRRGVQKFRLIFS
jgi:hypothetical protein